MQKNPNQKDPLMKKQREFIIYIKMHNNYHNLVNKNK